MLEATNLTSAYWFNNFFQESFEIPRGQASRDGDIEMGANAPMHSGELGLENFFKKVSFIDIISAVSPYETFCFSM